MTAKTHMTVKRKCEVELSANDVLDILGNFGLPEIAEVGKGIIHMLDGSPDKVYLESLKFDIQQRMLANNGVNGDKNPRGEVLSLFS